MQGASFTIKNTCIKSATQGKELKRIQIYKTKCTSKSMTFMTALSIYIVIQGIDNRTHCKWGKHAN